MKYIASALMLAISCNLIASNLQSPEDKSSEAAKTFVKIVSSNPYYPVYEEVTQSGQIVARASKEITRGIIYKANVIDTIKDLKTQKNIIIDQAAILSPRSAQKKFNELSIRYALTDLKNKEIEKEGQVQCISETLKRIQGELLEIKTERLRLESELQQQK